MITIDELEEYVKITKKIECLNYELSNNYGRNYAAIYFDLDIQNSLLENWTKKNIKE